MLRRRPPFWSHPWRGSAPTLILAATALVYIVLAFGQPARGARLWRYAYQWGGILTLVGLWVAAWRAQDRQPRHAAWRVAPWVLAGVALCIPPFQSSDVDVYVQVGRLQTHYDVNPYVTVPTDIEGTDSDRVLDGTWRDVPCVYGPLFAHICHGIVALTGEDPTRAPALFALLAALALLWIACVLRTRLGPDDRTRGDVRLWLLLSPFVLLHYLGHAHNDLLVGACLLQALVFVERRAPLRAAVLLAAAIALKLIAVLVVPFFLVHVARTYGRRVLLQALGLATTATLATAFPYILQLREFAWPRILTELRDPSHSLLEALESGVKLLGGNPTDVVSVAAVVAGLAFLAWCASRTWRASRATTYDANALAADTVLTLLVLLVAASAKFHPWYLGMVLPAALLLPRDHGARQATLLLTATWLLAFTGIGRVKGLDVALLTVLPLIVLPRVRARHRPESPPRHPGEVNPRT